MSVLSSLRVGYRAVVFGASGGIGSALTRLLADDPNCGQIYAGARTSPPAAPKSTPFRFDLTQEPSIAEATAQIASGGEIDLVIVATGILQTATSRPEKTLRALEASALAELYAVNAIGPALIAKHMSPALARGRKSVFAALSARVGSIGDNRLGGWHSYRASKAALNQLIRTCAIELAQKNKGAICVALHPGTVDTPLSKPFQSQAARDKIFTSELSAAHLLTVIDGLELSQSGMLIGWDGNPIPY